MQTHTRKLVALFAGAFAFAALLGGSLGIAAAITPGPLPSGPAYIGGPRETMEPEKFVSCLPAQSWNSIYVWDAAGQQWKHYINPAKGVPDYVNDPDVGGIDFIPKLSGLAILIDTPIPAPYFPDTNGSTCPN